MWSYPASSSINFCYHYCDRHVASTILSESHSCGPNFFSAQAIRKAILFVWFWWEREKPAAEVPPCKHKHGGYAAVHVSHCSSEPAGTASEVLHGARRMPGLQDGESSRKRSRQVAVLLREILGTLKCQQDLFKELRNPISRQKTDSTERHNRIIYKL